MTTVLNFGRDNAGYNAFAPAPSTNLFGTLLTINTAAAFTIPDDYENWIVVFSYSPGAAVWVDFTGATAVIPSVSSFVNVTTELLPASRKLTAGSEVSVISSIVGAYVGVMMYAIS
jgi:hypothetical protein